MQATWLLGKLPRLMQSRRGESSQLDIYAVHALVLAHLDVDAALLTGRCDVVEQLAEFRQSQTSACCPGTNVAGEGFHLDTVARRGLDMVLEERSDQTRGGLGFGPWSALTMNRDFFLGWRGS